MHLSILVRSMILLLLFKKKEYINLSLWVLIIISFQKKILQKLIYYTNSFRSAPKMLHAINEDMVLHIGNGSTTIIHTACMHDMISISTFS